MNRPPVAHRRPAREALRAARFRWPWQRLWRGRTEVAAMTGNDLRSAVIAVAGAGGPAGRAILPRLAAAGARVVAADAHAQRLAEVVRQARNDSEDAVITGDVVDLLDPAATREWADRTAAEYGRVDGLVHLVGGWRGAATFMESDLADWDWLQQHLVRTVQHTSLAFHDHLLRSSRGRYVLVSAAGATKPTAGNAAYAAAKAGAEAWTLAMADSFRRHPTAGAGGPSGPTAAAVILVVKALVHEQLRKERPNAKFAGFTDVADLAEAITGLWTRPAAEVNGQRLWLTPT